MDISSGDVSKPVPVQRNKPLEAGPLTDPDADEMIWTVDSDGVEDTES